MLTSAAPRPYRVLITGNCLGGMLEVAGREAISMLRLPAEIRFVRNYVNREAEPLSAELRDFAQQADFFVRQVGQGIDDPVAELVPPGTPTFRYPALRLNFLWPFATREHPRARWDPPFNQQGIFNVYLSDSLLAGIIEEEPDPERAFDRFMRIDPLTLTNIDRLFSATQAQIRTNGLHADICLWDEIERRYRDERIFWDAGHPTMEMLWPVTQAMLTSLGLGIDQTALAAIYRRFLPQRWSVSNIAPIHPRVAEHFGLSWWRPDLRCKLDMDGWFTYEEWVRRYIGFQHDLRFYSGAWYSNPRAGNLAAGEADLRAALADAPRNAVGRFHLACNLLNQNRAGEALPEIEAALGEPGVAEASRSAELHAEILIRLDRFEDALAPSRRAVGLCPAHARYHRTLGRMLARLARHEEAMAAFREAARLDPYDAENWLELGKMLADLGNGPEEAESAFRQATALAPEDKWAWSGLGAALLARGDLQEARAAVRKALTLDPTNQQFLRQAGEIFAARMAAQQPASAPQTA